MIRSLRQFSQGYQDNVIIRHSGFLKNRKRKTVYFFVFNNGPVDLLSFVLFCLIKWTACKIRFITCSVSFEGMCGAFYLFLYLLCFLPLSFYVSICVRACAL